MFVDFSAARLESLKAGLEHITDCTVRSQARHLVEAFAKDSYCFRKEVWHPLQASPAGEAEPVQEMLLHVLPCLRSKTCLYTAMSSLYGAGLHHAFDAFIIAQALNQAVMQNHLPVSINISPRSAGSADFWRMMRPVLSCFDPSSIVFELLEHEDIPEPANIATIQTLRHMGYRFALDDISAAPEDIRRLAHYAGIADFVKICGTVIQDWEIGLPGLDSLIAQIRAHATDSAIVAEWVTSTAMAHALGRMGLCAAQGRNLGARVQKLESRNLKPDSRRQTLQGGRLY